MLNSTNIECNLGDNMKTIKLMIGTSQLAMIQMFNGIFNKVVWASDNMETVAHYYEGAVVELEVKLLKSKQHQYIRNYDTLNTYKRGYNWGCAKMRCPAGAIWYSFSAEYLRKYLVSIHEIHPDLTPWQEEY